MTGGVQLRDVMAAWERGGMDAAIVAATERNAQSALSENQKRTRAAVRAVLRTRDGQVLLEWLVELVLLSPAVQTEVVFAAPGARDLAQIAAWQAGRSDIVHLLFAAMEEDEDERNDDA